MARRFVNKRIKREVHERDDWQCKKCGRIERYLCAHHIMAAMDGGDFTHSNLVTLCDRCHKEWHFAESVTTIQFDTWLQAPPYLALLVGWQHGNDREAIDAASKMYYSLARD